MKPKLIVTGLLCCCLLTACAPENEPPDSVDPEETAATSTTANTNDQLPTIIPPDFSNTVQGGIGETTGQYSYTEGEYTVLNVTLRMPVANIEGNDALQQTVSDRLNAMQEELERKIEQLYQQCLTDYRAGRESLTTPSVQVRFEVHYFTADALSMTYVLTETTGDGMVYTHRYHSNLDLRVGSEIRLISLLADGKTDGLLALMQTKLTESAPDGLYDGAAQKLQTLMDASWYISEGKLSICLEAGTVAPISSGVVLLSFTETELDALLSDYGKALL